MGQLEQIEWAKLLEAAVNEPGIISDAYRRFYGQYSLGNRIFALWQCSQRGIEPGPLASFGRWQELGRFVKKGEKAIALCMPLTRKRTSTDENGQETDSSYQFFTLKNNWFVLSQTQGQEYTPEPLPEWDEARALATLQITKVPFHLLNGNVQGYAAPGRQVSISPIAERPVKTLFHEVAHILLHVESDTLTDTEIMPRSLKEVEAESVAMLCCASLSVPGIEYSRAYIQSWSEGEPISNKSAQRIFAAADKILKAGTTSL